MKKVGILTGGGDCPGLNAVIRGLVTRCAKDGIEVYGFHEGWRGAIEKEGEWLSLEKVEGLQALGGTILGSSRTNVMKVENGVERVRRSMTELGLEALVAVGGDDTLGVAEKLRQDGMKIIGVPKTIDNDLNNTDYTFGFDTSSNVTMDALDKLHTTAKSHNRVMVVEIMGRHTGWIAIQAGMAGNAHVIVIPEFPMTADEICDIIRRRHEHGAKYSIIAIAEGCDIREYHEHELQRDDFGNVMLPKKNVAEELADIITAQTGIESRHVVLGHLVRGGSPSAFDRVLGTRMGIKAGELVVNGDFGKMIALDKTNIVAIPLSEGVSERKCVGEDFYNDAKLFFEFGI